MLYLKKNIIFEILVFTLIFTYIPKCLQLNFLAGELAPKLTIYSFIFSIAFTVLYRKKFSLSRDEKDTLVRFFAIYVSVLLVSLVAGLVNYPYYNDIMQGPVNQIEKLPKVYAFLIDHGISVTEQELLSVWMLARPIKGLFINTFWTFGLPVLIFVWYKDDFANGFLAFLQGLFASVVVIVLYGFLDLFYLSGSEFAAKILMTLNPLVHAIKIGGTWWPPLLWPNQFRSLFAEPSYYGIFMAFALPWLWYILEECHNKKKHVLCWILLFFCIFFLFLTKSRTANVLLFGELVLLLLCKVKSFFKSKKILLSVFSCAILAFGASLAFFNCGAKQAFNETTASSYLEENIGSLTSMDKRSNRSRYSIMLADLKIGLTHPLLGVGLSLRNAYIAEALPDKEHLSKETLTWIENQREKGILRAGFPKLGEYTSRFAETGILGLAVFMFPPIVLIWKLIRLLWTHTKNLEMECKLTEYFLISFLGVLATGIGDNLNITYSYWLLLGLGFALLHHVTIKANEGK